MNAGKLIKMLRVAEGIQQDELARDLEVTRPYLSQIETGKKDPSLSFLKNVSNRFEIPLPLLVLGEDDGDLMPELRELLSNLLATKINLWSMYGRDAKRDKSA